MAHEDIRSVMERFQNQLMALPNVQGVGIGEKGGKQVVKVFVDRKVPESELQANEIVPRNLGDFETDVEEIGIVTPQNLQGA